MKIKDWITVNKYRLISFLILLVSAIIVVLLFASGQGTRDYFFKRYQSVLRWRNDKLVEEIDVIAREKYKQKRITEEKLEAIEDQISSIKEERESNDDFVETISYRELSDLLGSLVE